MRYRPILTPAQLEEARSWIGDCFEEVCSPALTPREIEAGIMRHYEGGILAFILACAN